MDHCLLFKAVRNKVKDERLRILSATLCDGTVDSMPVIATRAKIETKDCHALFEVTCRLGKKIFSRRYVGALLFFATCILLSRKTCYGATPFMNSWCYLFAFIRHASHTICLCAKTRVASWHSPTKRTQGLTQGMFTNSEMVREQNKET